MNRHLVAPERRRCPLRGDMKEHCTESQENKITFGCRHEGISTINKLPLQLNIEEQLGLSRNKQGNKQEDFFSCPMTSN